jgi:hypothetical protein
MRYQTAVFKFITDLFRTTASYFKSASGFSSAFEFLEPFYHSPSAMKLLSILQKKLIRVVITAAMAVLLFASPSEQKQMKASGCPNRNSSSCNMKRSPVTCGSNNCRYENTCRAELNGFNVNRDCRRLFCGGYTPAPAPAPKVSDPPPCGQLSSPCNGESGVFLCGVRQCQYLNSCLAELNGFNVARDCTRIYN